MQLEKRLKKYLGAVVSAIIFLVVVIIFIPSVFAVNYPSEGWQSLPGKVKAIITYNGEKIIINNESANKAYFIPSATQGEVDSFLGKHPANLDVDYCGNGICKVGFGENCDTCPKDCGICANKIFNWQVLGQPFNPWNVFSVGVCGDGVCDSKLGENPSTCPYDCQPGCCSLVGFEIPNHCQLYGDIDSCFADKACLPLYNYNVSFGPQYFICETHPEYPCSVILDPEECNLSPLCEFQGGAGGTCITDRSGRSQYERHKSCWEIDNQGDCNMISSCKWTGQIDSPGCSRYCGKNVFDINAEYLGYTYQNCVIESSIFGMSSIEPDYIGSCGNGVCDSAAPSFETTFNCPVDCATFGANGKMIPVDGSCGDGVCQLWESKGEPQYCYIDCGDIGEGICMDYNDVCYSLSPLEKSYTFGACDYYSNSIDCSRAKSRNECNRYGCYWQAWYQRPCGDGICNSSQGENCTTCPRDCGFCQRQYYCEGDSACIGHTNQAACLSSGCTWGEGGVGGN